jgi:hypothetical protein
MREAVTFASPTIVEDPEGGLLMGILIALSELTALSIALGHRLSCTHPLGYLN